MPPLMFRFLLITVLALAGCTPRIAVIPGTGGKEFELWKEHQANVAAIESWELKGKVGVKTGKKGGSATLKWIYIEDDQEIELYGPFGGGRIIISVEPEYAVLRDAKGRIIEGESAEDVLYQRLGWQIPFNELVMWSRGLPNSGAENLQFDQHGFLKSLDEDIWHVEYQEYQITNDLTLPRKLTITALPGTMEVYDDDGNYLGDDLSVKVILKRWWDVKSDASN